MTLMSFKPHISVSGRVLRPGDHMPAMQNIPNPKPSLEELILQALADDSTKTFGQIEVVCLRPVDVINTFAVEDLSSRVDKELRRLIACGKVILVARRPELCFRKGTVLDRIVKEIEQSEQD